MLHPPAEFSLLPFWFWNDTLEQAQIVRQIDDFQAHGIHGFVIHPRVGLPRDCGWMSRKLLDFMHIAIDQAARRQMKVILYDEGMYPSGSSSGQVVQANPQLACRGLALHEVRSPLPPTANIIAEINHNGQRKWIVDRPVDAYIRGLHYSADERGEDEPPAGDILNPQTASTVLRLVYDVFAQEFGRHFGDTILGMFTDEPNPLGKCREKDVRPGTTGIVGDISRLLGYDFAPHLHRLWSQAEADRRYQLDFQRGIRLRLNETWYAPLSDWCRRHQIALCGHPDHGDEIGVQRYFQIPGQDLVWRWVEPGKPSGLECAEATQGKCTSSAMIHLGRRRNSNEFAGAYGAQTTFDEVRALANWCLVRGVNLLIPHAFYYSVRGIRRDEQPPQIGPHTPPWDDGRFKTFANECRRLCWINTDCRHLCHVAILTHDDRCPFPAAALLLAHQRDFNYLDPQTLLHEANVDADGIRVGEMIYRLLLIDGDEPLSDAVMARLHPMLESGRVLRWSGRPAATMPSTQDLPTLLNAVDAAGKLPLQLQTASRAIRLRLVEKEGRQYALIFNEGFAPASCNVISEFGWNDLTTATVSEDAITLAPFEMRLHAIG